MSLQSPRSPRVPQKTHLTYAEPQEDNERTQQAQNQNNQGFDNMNANTQNQNQNMGPEFGYESEEEWKRKMMMQEYHNAMELRRKQSIEVFNPDSGI